jgi:hypothetical protein
MIIDGHVHFWDMARQEDILIVRLRAELQRNYFPKDLWPLVGICVPLRGIPLPVAGQSLQGAGVCFCPVSADGPPAAAPRASSATDAYTAWSKGLAFVKPKLWNWTSRRPSSPRSRRTINSSRCPSQPPLTFDAQGNLSPF